MRLIDADAMNEELFYKQVGGKDSLITAETAFNMIVAQPTAYDIDNVVAQIKKEKDEDGMVCYINDRPVIEKSKAIEIVKGGGADA